MSLSTVPWEEKPKDVAEGGGSEHVSNGTPRFMMLLSPGVPLGQQPGGGGVAGETHAGG